MVSTAFSSKIKKLLVIVFVVCGVSNRKMRVVGGNVTQVHEFPWLAGLFKNGQFYCGATLLTRKHVLTAAHCINGFEYQNLM